MKANSIKIQPVKGLRVRTGLEAGYWTCTGVSGPRDARGIYHWPSASLCYKPKYAPIFGAPAAPGGGED